MRGLTRRHAKGVNDIMAARVAVLFSNGDESIQIKAVHNVR